MIKTITAFTLAHSVTLAMATLGFVHVPQAPVEAVIALSIIFLASELAKQHRGETGLTTRAPWLVALCFGLLHGFGFAGALTEVGLPQSDIPLALLFFNVGVEVGQLMFVAGVLVVTWMIKNDEVQMACLDRTGTGLCDWFVGSVLVYPADSIVLVNNEIKD